MQICSKWWAGCPARMLEKYARSGLEEADRGQHRGVDWGRQSLSAELCVLMRHHWSASQGYVGPDMQFNAFHWLYYDLHGAHAVQAAVKKAPKLSKEDAVKLRQQNDPNFGKKKEVQEAPGKRKSAAGNQPSQTAKRAKTEVLSYHPTIVAFMQHASYIVMQSLLLLWIVDAAHSIIGV